MKPTKKSPGGSIKRAVSLPKILDSWVCAVAADEGWPYSAVLQDAVRVYAERRKASKIEEQYRNYYAEAAHAEADKRLADEFFELSKDPWP